MIKPNIRSSNRQLLATQKSPSNTPLVFHLPLTLTTNSFNSFFSTSKKAKIKFFLVNIHLDYLRISATGFNKKSFINLVSYLGLPVPCFENKLSWHPDPNMPKSKKYQNSIESHTGIKLGYTKRPKDKSKKTKYVYDIMIDFTGAYFVDLSLLKQIELVYYLNSNWKLKCHRLDVAIDDYSREIFPVGQMISAFLEGNQHGFQVIDDSYLDIIDNKLSGTLGIGSRRSSFFVRIYNKHKLFVRWEAELKLDKSQRLFNELARVRNSSLSNDLSAKCFQAVLLKAAIGGVDSRKKSIVNSSENDTTKRRSSSSFWSKFVNTLYSSIDN